MYMSVFHRIGFKLLDGGDTTAILPRKKGDNGLFISRVPKVFLFVGLTTLGTLTEFQLVGLLR